MALPGIALLKRIGERKCGYTLVVENIDVTVPRPVKPSAGRIFNGMVANDT